MKHAEQNRIQTFAFVISISLAVAFSLGFVSNFRLKTLTIEQYSIKLESRINPNNAPIESLVRLPGLGAGRAGAIIAYRQNVKEKTTEKTAFQNCNDLQKVKGIGPKTVQNLSEWLKFD